MVVGALVPIATAAIGIVASRKQEDRRALAEAVEALAGDAQTFTFAWSDHLDQIEIEEGGDDIDWTPQPVRAEILAIMRDLPRWSARIKMLGGVELGEAAMQVRVAVAHVIDNRPQITDEQLERLAAGKIRVTDLDFGPDPLGPALDALVDAASDDPLLKRGRRIWPGRDHSATASTRS